MFNKLVTSLQNINKLNILKAPSKQCYIKKYDLNQNQIRVFGFMQVVYDKRVEVDV